MSIYTTSPVGDVQLTASIANPPSGKGKKGKNPAKKGGGQVRAPSLMGDPAVTEKSSASTSMTCTMPSGIKKNELLIAYVGGDYAASGATLSTSTTGWDTLVSHGNSTSDCYQAIMWKIAENASEADLVVTSSHSQQMAAIIRRVKDTHQTYPFLGYYIHTMDNSGRNAYVIVPQQIEDKCMVFAGYSGDGGDQVPGLISNFGANQIDWVDDTYAQSMGSASTSGVGICTAFNETAANTFDRYSQSAPLASTGWRLPVGDIGVVMCAIIRPAGYDTSDYNLIYSPRDCTEGNTNDSITANFWHNSSLGTGTYDQVGMDGVANHASFISDNNASQTNCTSFQAWRGSYSLDDMYGDVEHYVARVFIKKEATQTAIPRIGLYDSTGAASTPNGVNTSVQLEVQLGTLYSYNDTLVGNSSWSIRTADSNLPDGSPIVGDWWEVCIEGDCIQTTPSLGIWPDAHSTYGGVSSAGPTGGVTLGWAELRLGTTLADVEGSDLVGLPPDDGRFDDYLVYDAHNGISIGEKNGIVPMKSYNGARYQEAGSGLAAIYAVASQGNLRTANYTDWCTIDTGQINFTARQQFGLLATSTRAIGVGCRMDTLGQNGYIAMISGQWTSTPLLEIVPIVASAFGTAVATVQLEVGSVDYTYQWFDLSISCDADEIVASVTYGYGDWGPTAKTQDTKSVTYVSTDLNANTSACFSMYATGGDMLCTAHGPFTVVDYSP